MRTHFYNADKKLDSITEEKVIENIKGQCDKIRKSAGKLYSPREIETAIKNSDGKNKIRLVGREEASKKGYLALNIEGKDVELFCFDFGERVVIEGRGKIEIGFADFHDIDGNALSLTGGEGKIHHSKFTNSSKAGIFSDQGKWEIYGNIIKNNHSYGIYGGYEADLDLYENAIIDNSGYEVRMLGEKEVYN
jgi:hypothetical protein